MIGLSRGKTGVTETTHTGRLRGAVMRTVIFLATGWATISVPLALLAGRLLHRAKALADAHEPVRHRIGVRAA